MSNTIQNRAVPSPIDTTPTPTPNAASRSAPTTPTGGQGRGAAQFEGLEARTTRPASADAAAGTAMPLRRASLSDLRPPSQQLSGAPQLSGHPSLMASRPALNIAISQNAPTTVAEAKVKTSAEETKVKTPAEETKVKTPVEETKAKTPVEETKVKAPLEETKAKTSAEETKVKTPAEETKVKTSAEETKVKTPVEETKVKTPVEETKVKTSAEETQAKTPVEETKVKTPAEETKVKTPAEETKVKTPVEETKVKTAVEETKVKTPVEETKAKTSAEETKVKTPAEETKVKTPVEETKAKTSVEETKAKTPVEETKVKTPVEETKAKTPVEETKVKTPLDEPKVKAQVDEDKPKTSLGGPKLSSSSSGAPPMRPLNLRPKPPLAKPASTPPNPDAATLAATTNKLPPANVSGKELTDALLATLAQRSVTYGAGHALALIAQTITLLSAGKHGVSKEGMGVASNVVGGFVAALGKEAVGEFMKTRPSLGATIKLPSTTAMQREGPRAMAGFNDMWTAIAGGMSGVAIANTLTPVLIKSFEAKGMNEHMARASAMAVTAIAQRVVSTGFDTLSDLTSTVMKSKLPGATGGNVVNDKMDYATMAAGMVARMGINFGLTLPVGVPVGLGMALANGNPFEKAALSAFPAWIGLNGWINAKMNMAALLKKDTSPAATAQPPIQMNNLGNV